MLENGNQTGGPTVLSHLSPSAAEEPGSAFEASLLTVQPCISRSCAYCTAFFCCWWGWWWGQGWLLLLFPMLDEPDKQQGGRGLERNAVKNISQTVKRNSFLSAPSPPSLHPDLLPEIHILQGRFT